MSSLSLPLLEMIGRPGLVSLSSRTNEDLWDFLLPHLHSELSGQGIVTLIASMEGQMAPKLSFWRGHDDMVLLSPTSSAQFVQWITELEAGSLNGDRFAVIVPVFESEKWADLGCFLAKLVKLSQICQIFMLFEGHNQQKAKKFSPYFKFAAEFAPIRPIKDDKGAVRWLRTAIAIRRNNYTGDTPSYEEHDLEYLGA